MPEKCTLAALIGQALLGSRGHLQNEINSSRTQSSQSPQRILERSIGVLTVPARPRLTTNLEDAHAIKTVLEESVEDYFGSDRASFS